MTYRSTRGYMQMSIIILMSIHSPGMHGEIIIDDANRDIYVYIYFCEWKKSSYHSTTVSISNFTPSAR